MDVDKGKASSSSKSYELPWVWAKAVLPPQLNPESRSETAGDSLKPCTQVEKYRPTLVSEIVGNREAVERLQVVSEEGNMPNIILAVSLGLYRSAIQAAAQLGLHLPAIHAGSSRHREDHQHPVFGTCTAGSHLQGGRAGAERLR